MKRKKTKNCLPPDKVSKSNPEKVLHLLNLITTIKTPTCYTEPVEVTTPKKKNNKKKKYCVIIKTAYAKVKPTAQHTQG